MSIPTLKSLPLAGVKVLAVEQFGAAPFGTLFLASLGAEVVKVEEPGAGDIARGVGPYRVGPASATDGSLYFQSLNLGKKSLTLDLKSDAGRAVFRELLPSFDAVASNLRGDVVEKLGLTYDQLKAFNPRLVCAHLTAYGRDDDRASWPGYDYIMQAEAGCCSVTGEPGSPPTRFGLSVVDWMAGISMSLGLVSGVLHARETGEGGDIDVNLFDTALYNLSYVGVWAMNAGHRQEKVPRGGHPSLIPSHMCKTADGWMFVMCGGKDSLWRVFCRIVDRAEWIDDPRFATSAARHKHRTRLIELIDDAMSIRTTEEWLSLLTGKVPVGPVLDVEQALANPYVHRTGRVRSVSYGDAVAIRVLRNPIRWGQSSNDLHAAPSLGEHTSEILAAHGVDAERIDALHGAGVIWAPSVAPVATESLSDAT